VLISNGFAVKSPSPRRELEVRQYLIVRTLAVLAIGSPLQSPAP